MPPRPHRSRPAGFSLIEIMVTISIIAVVVGLAIVGYRQAQNMAKRSRTKIVLKQAVAAATEYQARTGQVINSSDNVPFDWTTPKEHNAPNFSGSSVINGVNADIERFVWACMQLEASKAILLTLGDRLQDTDGNGFLEIVDGFNHPDTPTFGNPLGYRHSFTPPTSSTPPHEFIPSPRPFFVSYGPQGKQIATQDYYLYSHQLD